MGVAAPRAEELLNTINTNVMDLFQLPQNNPYEDRVRAFLKNKKGLELKGYGSSLVSFAVGMLICAGLSILFSYNGSFNFVDKITDLPVYVNPELVNIDSIETKYKGMVVEAKKEAEAYYERRKYNNRIATEDSKEWKKKLNRKNVLEDQSLVFIHEAQNKNDGKIAAAKADYVKTLMSHKKDQKEKGIGLAGIAVCSTLLFFFVSGIESIMRI